MNIYKLNIKIIYKFLQSCYLLFLYIFTLKSVVDYQDLFLLIINVSYKNYNLLLSKNNIEISILHFAFYGIVAYIAGSYNAIVSNSNRPYH